MDILGNMKSSLLHEISAAQQT